MTEMTIEQNLVLGHISVLELWLPKRAYLPSNVFLNDKKLVEFMYCIFSVE